jgi:F-type H+-transporting ATPase subunit gamma
MTATIAGLRRKIASASDLQSVVRTMKAQAAASIEQYQRSVEALDDYQRTVSLGLGVCIRLRLRGVVASPRDHRQPAVRIVVLGSDQGLVGRFNDVVGDLAQTLVAAQSGPVTIWTVGERVRESLVDAGKTIEHSFDVPASVDGIVTLVGQLLVADDTFLDESRITELYLVYNQMAPAVTYHPVSVQLLPLDDGWRAREAATTWPTSGLPEVLDPNAETLAAFIREYLFVSLFSACAESLASENTSRLAAMQRADKNIDDVRETLSGEFHRLRQASIDEELFDVVAGYEALQTRGGRQR